MFGKKCSLCGGNLVGGKCQECGLDNAKKRMYQVNDKDNNGEYTSYENTQKSSYGGVSNEEFFGQRRAVQEKYERQPTSNQYGSGADNKQGKTQNRPPQRPYGAPPRPYGTPPSREELDENGRPKRRKNPIATIIWFFVIIQLVSALFSVLATTFSGF